MATIRRLFKQGNSVVVSVPVWMLEYTGMGVGDQVLMEGSVVTRMIQFQKWNPPGPGEVVTGEQDRKLDPQP